MARVIVIGGGITGQLVQLRVPDARVLDWRREGTSLTRSFGTNYLWAPLPGVTCRAFSVMTTIDGLPPTPEAITRYKARVGKTGDEATWAAQFRWSQTGYDIVEWPRQLTVDFGVVVEYIDPARKVVFARVNGLQQSYAYDLLVSTIPAYSLAAMLRPGSAPTNWTYSPIYAYVLPRPLDAPPLSSGVWLVNYISDSAIPAYRTTDRDGQRHYELLNPGMGIPTKRIVPGKIFTRPEIQEWIAGLQHRDIYCFGRFGAWEPEELVHETDARIRAWAEAKGL